MGADPLQIPSVRWSMNSHSFSSISVIVGDLNVMRAIDFPHEANAVLVIDANTVLPGPISLQRLQSVSGRSAQIIQIHGGLELEFE
jgi:hypothetical protein